MGAPAVLRRGLPGLRHRGPRAGLLRPPLLRGARHRVPVQPELRQEPGPLRRTRGRPECRAQLEGGRIPGVRKQLFADLTELMPEKDWSFVTRQIGMFSFTGLSKEQVENMTNKW